MSKKINWGILGPGRIAQDFANDMSFSKLGTLKAVASRTLARAQEFADKYGASTAYGSYEELFDDESIDIVYIAVPHAFHADITMRALKAGKPVLCEKPLTVNLALTTQLTELAQQKGLYLMEGMWTYFLPAINKAKQWVDEGRIGKIKHLLCDFGSVQPLDDNDRWYNPDLAGGVLLDMGCYNLSLANFFMDGEIKNTHIIAKKATTGVDKELHITYEYDDAIATLIASFVCQLPNCTKIVGEKGYISIPDFWRTKACDLFLNDGVEEHFVDTSNGTGFEHEIDAVSQNLIDGKLQSDVVPHNYSRQLAGQMDYILESI